MCCSCCSQVDSGLAFFKKEKFNTSVIANNRGEGLELGRFSHLPTPGHQLRENGEDLLFFSLSSRKFWNVGKKGKQTFEKMFFFLLL